MAVYRVPRRNPIGRNFRVVAWSAVIVLLGICAISIHTPSGLGDPSRRALAWTAGVIVALAIALAYATAVRVGSRKFKESLEFQVSDERITQRREGQNTVEIPLNQIESIFEYRGWLVVQSSEAGQRKRVAIPLEVRDLEEIKKQLSVYRTIAIRKARISWSSYVLFALAIVAGFYLLTSHTTMVIAVAGGVILLLEVLGFYSIWRLRGEATSFKLVLLCDILAWMLTAWIVYERARGVM